jgi:hypothetical protein
MEMQCAGLAIAMVGIGAAMLPIDHAEQKAETGALHFRLTPKYRLLNPRNIAT